MEDKFGGQMSHLDYMLSVRFPDGDIRCIFQPSQEVPFFENGGLTYRKNGYIFVYPVAVTHQMDVFVADGEARRLVKSVAIRAEQSTALLVFPSAIQKDSAPPSFAHTEPKAKETVVMRSRFDAAEHVAYLAAGKNRIVGTATVHRKDGSTATCANEEVLMVPSTPYFVEFVSILRAGNLPKADESNKPGRQFAALLKRTRCDSLGNFVFEGIPSGRWHIATAAPAENHRVDYVMVRDIDVPEATDAGSVQLGDGDLVRKPRP